MDLWIKSQDKKLLIKVNHIMRINNRIFAGDTLGEYDSEERALEVLDEIQKLLVGDVLLFKNVDIDGELGKYLEPSKALWFDDKTGKPEIEYLHRDCIVYEMPEK